MTRPSSEAAARIARDIAGSGPGAALAPELGSWLAGSARFAAFVEDHRSKIRRKLRGAPDEASVRDVRAELAVAHRLLADGHVALAFEAYKRGGGPDFTLTYRGGRPLNLEVTRLRRPPDTTAVAGVVLGKLRQLPPGVPNLLLISVEGAPADRFDVGAAVRTLRARADRKDDAYFAFRGVDGTRVFWDGFLRLGGVIVWNEAAGGQQVTEDDQRVTPWLNGSARIAIPEAAMRAVVACLRT